MGVGVLLITHSGLGPALLHVATNTFGSLSLTVDCLEVTSDPDPFTLKEQAKATIQKLDTGLGVLILTDMFGSTPSNIAQELQQNHLRLRIVTGLNLPMLFRILNYSHLPLSQLADKAVSGAKSGIFEQIHDLTNNQKKNPAHSKKRILVMES